MANSKSKKTKDQRARNATRWNQQQQSAGARRITVLLPPSSVEKLQALEDVFGSKRAAIIAAIDHLSCGGIVDFRLLWRNR